MGTEKYRYKKYNLEVQGYQEVRDVSVQLKLLVNSIVDIRLKKRVKKVEGGVS